MIRSVVRGALMIVLALAAPAKAQESGAERSENQSAGGSSAGGPQMPPPAVTVATVQGRTIPVTYEYAARVAASREVEVRARVGGILLDREFEEGARVSQNQVLFRIDPREYAAQVAAAKAAVAQAQAQLTNARRTEERQRQLVQSGATSTASLDDAVAQRQLLEAQLASANAQLDTANLSLTYATVVAPLGGITSREQVPEGSLVSVNSLLTRISQLDPIYVNFSAADTEAFQIRALIERTAQTDVIGRLKAYVVFGDGTTYDKVGIIDFTAASIDQDTGTISSRAVFNNTQQRLLPGQFVRIRIEGLTLENAIEIPATALMQNPDGQFVFTVNEKNVAEVRPVTVGREMNERIVVASGLKPGDRVVTEGVVKVRPGTPVSPSEAAAGGSEGAPDGKAGAEAGGAAGTAGAAR